MAYEFSVSDPVVSHRGSKTFISWTITETGEVAAASEWSIDGVSAPAEVWLHVVDLVNSDGGGTTLRPELGLEAAWTSGEANHLFEAASADAHHRIPGRADDPHRWGGVTGNDGARTLYGRSKPNATLGAAGLVVTEITVVVR